MIVYQCEDTLESIFTAIYRAYEEKRNPADTRISLNRELLLFADYYLVTEEPQKVQKVIRTLKRQFGEDDYLSLCYALSTDSGEKAQAVYQTIAAGLKRKCSRGHLFDLLTNDFVHQCFTLAKSAGNERQHLIQFLRFHELDNGILYAKVGPKYNLLTFIMPHFADRLPMENFMIYDDYRNFFAVHPAGKQWYLIQGDELNGPVERWQYSEEENNYQELFRCFCHSIAIKERENRRLQQNMMPLRFQEYMTEFNKKC